MKITCQRVVRNMLNILQGLLELLQAAIEDIGRNIFEGVTLFCRATEKL